MSTTTAPFVPEPLKLEAISGPPMEKVAVQPGKPIVLGRASIADIRLLDETVSRRHAQVFLRAETWLVTDLESRHGTLLNGVPLTPNTPSPLQHGDTLSIGPWAFRVQTKAGGYTTSIVTMDDDASGPSQARVQRVPVAELSLRAQARLDLLIESAAQIAGATSEATLGSTVLDALVKGTGFPRAAFIKQMGPGDEVELIAYHGPSPGSMPGMDATSTGSASPGGFPTPQSFQQAKFSPSRSLLRAASEGQMVRMDAGSSSNYGQSIIDMGISSALCAPVSTSAAPGALPVAYLYLDSRGNEATVQPDAAAFCQAIARICGLALSNLNRANIEVRQKQMEGELLAARQAQQLIMPPSTGTHGSLAYAMHSEPGRIVAGDLFDFIDLEPGKAGGKVAILLGDVSGKGVSAALLMATAQAYINAALLHNPDPAAALTACNKHIVQHAQGTRFISLWLGVFNLIERTVQYVDAGHGYWLLRPPGGEPQRVECVGGVPLGVDEDAQYHSESLALAPGSRLIVYSDGVHEQPNPDGEEFGLERTLASLSPAEHPEADVVSLVQSVKVHAAPQLLSMSGSHRPFASGPEVNLADDVTVASIQIGSV